MQSYDDEPLVNVGCGEDISISELAALVGRIVGYDGAVVFDKSKPDGTPRKLLDVSRLGSLGWRPRIRLEDGIRTTYDWYRSNARP
jgi:GDP-L-fucose synthase